MISLIYVFFAHGFEEMEAIVAVDILRRAELEVRTVGVGAKTITGAHGITIHCDLQDSKAITKDLEMIVLPGGMPGTLNLEKAPSVQAFIKHALQNDLWIGAICAAPSILGHMGLVEGKNLTVFPGFESEMTGANVLDQQVVQDGKLITGKGPGAAIEFALLLAKCLAGETEATAVGASLQ